MFFRLRRFSKIPYLGRVFSFIYRLYNIIYGASIPLDIELCETNNFPHGIHGIFISRNAKIGSYNTIYQQVTIGSIQTIGHHKLGSPELGSYCLFGAGAKIIGKINVGDNVNVGANCVVTDSINSHTTVVCAKNRVFPRGKD